MSSCQESGIEHVLMCDVSRGHELMLSNILIKLSHPPNVSRVLGSHESPKLSDKSSEPEIHLKYGL